MERKANEKPFDIGLMTGGHGSKLYGVKISFNQGEFNEAISRYIIRHIEEDAHGYDIGIAIDSECFMLSAEIRIVCTAEWFLREIQAYVDALGIGAK